MNLAQFPFLHAGQMRCPETFHNAGWYDQAGTKIGWGDLSIADLRAIQAKLEVEDAFYVLYENDSFWNFVTANPGTVGAQCETSPDEQRPGLDYVRARAALAILPTIIYRYTDYENLGTWPFTGRCGESVEVNIVRRPK